MALHSKAAAAAARQPVAAAPASRVLPLQWRSRSGVAAQAAAAAGKQQQPSTGPVVSAESGWGVEVPANAPKPAAQPAKRAAKNGKAAAAGAAPVPAAPTRESRREKRSSTPYVALQSPQGQMGLAMLQETLRVQEEQQQQQQEAAAAAAAAGGPSLRDVKASLAAATPGGKRKKPIAAQLAERRAAGAEGDEDEYDDDGIAANATPSFQVTFSETGTDIIDFTKEGQPDALWEDEGATAAAEEEDDGGFGSLGWDQFGAAESDDEEEEAGGPQASVPEEVRLLREMANEDDWGLDGFEDPAAPRRGARPSLLSEALREQREREEGVAAALAPSGDAIAWGGSGGATGLDLEEQEAVLSRFFRPHEVKRYMAAQREVDENYAEMRARAAGVGASERRLHYQLKVISGSAAGRRLLSARGAQTRPMMEKVRAAIFDMVQSQAGSVGGLPPGCRWLDLFAGTGSVGLEALSRGAGEAHFVELDPWVHRRVLSRNIAACGFDRAATRHTCKAEEFLRRAAAAPRFAGGAFDFISVCPPYLLVSYPELYDLLEASGLIHPGTIAFVEYPKQLSEHVRPTLGPLVKVRDRKYGRTWIAVYAPAEEGGGADGSGGPAPVGAEWGL